MKHISFYKNLFWQYGLQGLRYIFPLLLVPYLTRVLGTDSYAVYAYVLSFMGIIQTIADFGFTLSGTKGVVKKRDDTISVSQLVGAITFARLLLLAFLVAVVLAAIYFIPIMSENLTYVMLAFVGVSLRALLPDFVFQGYEQMGPLTTRYFVSKGLTVALSFLFVKTPEDLLLVAIADIAGGIVGLIWSFLAMRRLFQVWISFPSIQATLCELRTSAIYCISNVSSSLFSGFTTIIIGLAITDKSSIAFWSLTLTTVNAVQALYTPITNSLYPHMLNSSDYSFAKKLALMALPVLLIGTLAYCYLSKPIMLLLGGTEYVGGARIMCLVSPVLLFSFYSMLIGWPVLGAMGYVKELTTSTVFTGLINIATLMCLYLSGRADIEAICFVRWATDALLLASRSYYIRKIRASQNGISH